MKVPPISISQYYSGTPSRSQTQVLQPTVSNITNFGNQKLHCPSLTGVTYFRSENIPSVPECAIVWDYDGSLKTFEGNYSTLNDLVQRTKATNSICTLRPLEGIQKHADTLRGLDINYLILNGGTQIYRKPPETETSAWIKSLKAEDESFKYRDWLESQISWNHEKALQIMKAACEKEGNPEKISLPCPKSGVQYNDSRKDNAERKKLADQILQELRNAGFDADYIRDLNPGYPPLYRFFPRNLTKAMPVKYLAEQGNLTRARIVTVGDGDADIPMLQPEAYGPYQNQAVPIGRISQDSRLKGQHVIRGVNTSDDLSRTIRDILDPKPESRTTPTFSGCWAFKVKDEAGSFLQKKVVLGFPEHGIPIDIVAMEQQKDGSYEYLLASYDDLDAFNTASGEELDDLLQQARTVALVPTFTLQEGVDFEDLCEVVRREALNTRKLKIPDSVKVKQKIIETQKKDRYAQLVSIAQAEQTTPTVAFGNSLTKLAQVSHFNQQETNFSSTGHTQPLPLEPSFYANNVRTARSARRISRQLEEIMAENGLDNHDVRAGVGIMTTPYTLATRLPHYKRLMYSLFPGVCKNSWVSGYPDRVQIAKIFKTMKHRTSDKPLVVHIVSGNEHYAYWKKEGYSYWESQDVPFWESIKQLKEFGLRSYDVIRINLANNETWSRDLQEIKRRYPSQRLSLQIHGHDLEMYKENLSVLAKKLADISDYIDEFQLDESLSRGKQSNMELYRQVYLAIESEFLNRKKMLKPMVFSGGIGPKTVKTIFEQIFSFCGFAGTDAVKGLKYPSILGLNLGISPHKVKQTFFEYLNATSLLRNSRECSRIGA